jgi:predicted NACHT family NTPase
VNGLARIPLMLSLLCRVFEETGGTLPSRRAELYERCLKGLLLDWRHEDKRADSREVAEVLVENIIERTAKAAYALYPQSQFTRLDFANQLGFGEGRLDEASRFIQTLIGHGQLVSASAAHARCPARNHRRTG